MKTRRFVLFGGLAASGALVVGYALWPSDRLARVDYLAAGPRERFLSNWIKIAEDDTVTVVIPHQDMGTGIFTALPQMAAEELDADWSKVRGVQAPADPEFANGALAEGFGLSREGIDPQSMPPFLRELALRGFRIIAEHMNLQVTGGSSAVRFTGVYGMRVAGAAARTMLIRAAAERWDVEPTSCAARMSRVYHEATGRSLSFGELVRAAAQFDPPLDPPLKPRSAYTLIGKSLPRADIPPKTNGTAVYGIDVEVPQMRFAAIAICPVLGGKLKSVDTSVILGRRGIDKVVTLDDSVVVVADRFWRASNAVSDLAPVWKDNGNGELNSAAIYAKRSTALERGPYIEDLSKGNGAKALTGRIFEARYEVPYLAHATMEPMNATAVYHGDSLKVWSGVQDGLGARAFCAKVANLTLDQVEFNVTKLGGGFGRRLPGAFNYLDYVVRTAMAMKGVPIKLIFSREEDIRHDYYRPNVLSHFQAAFDEADRPVAWINYYTTEDGPNPEAHIPYAVPNQEYKSVKVTTPVPVGAWRSVESSWHGFFIESFIDELAYEAKMDPVQFRLSLLKNKPRHTAVLRRLALESGWANPLVGHHLGVALFESFGTIVGEVAEISVGASGALQVHRITAVADARTAVNPNGLKAQLEGAIIFGLSAALYGKITIEHGGVVQSNFPDYRMVRLKNCPRIDVVLLNSDGPYGGGGEPGVPPLAPALTNAVFAATGRRLRSLPLPAGPLRVEAGTRARL
jgi:isoquinoline 1-oxidoreductase beta subunit